MIQLHEPWIKLKETLDQKDYDLINDLQAQCISIDKTALKLELDYKLSGAIASDKHSSVQNINEFMYFNDELLIGYIGICSFGGANSPSEANGMVHPDYRCQGVFKKLSELVIDEWRRRKSSSILLLCDRNSTAGQKFIDKTGVKKKHSEFEMYLMKDYIKPDSRLFCGLTFRKAYNSDAFEIARQNAIYFDINSLDSENNSKDCEREKENDILESDLIMPEEEEKRGMAIYLAEIDDKIIGKVHLQLSGATGGIYGLGVLPEHRGKGYGRAILLKAIEKLKEANMDEIMLQVEAENDKALNLYKSCGFFETSTMDYYEIRK